jgi:hypothetical protein
MATRDAIQTALKRFEEEMKADGFKLTLSEYVKLLQLKQDLADDEIREVKVSWVETAEPSRER